MLSETTAICPPGMTLWQFTTNLGVCGLSNLGTFGSIFVSSGGNNYNEVYSPISKSV